MPASVTAELCWTRIIVFVLATEWPLGIIQLDFDGSGGVKIQHASQALPARGDRPRKPRRGPAGTWLFPSQKGHNLCQRSRARSTSPYPQTAAVLQAAPHAELNPVQVLVGRIQRVRLGFAVSSPE